MSFAQQAVSLPAVAQPRGARRSRGTAAPRRVRGGVVRVSASKYSLIATGTNLPHPDKVQKGGEDAWFVRVGSSGGGQMYVADGVGGFNEQGVDPGLYARVLTYEAAKAQAAMARNPLSRPDLKKVIAAAQEATKLPGASTMVVIECDGTKIKAANLGDSGFRVVRAGKVIFASPAQEHYFNCPYQLGFEPLSEDTDTANDAEVFDIAVQPGDLVIAGSDGLFDNVFDEEIAEVATSAVMSVRGAGALSAARAASEALAAGPGGVSSVDVVCLLRSRFCTRSFLLTDYENGPTLLSLTPPTRFPAGALIPSHAFVTTSTESNHVSMYTSSFDNVSHIVNE